MVGDQPSADLAVLQACILGHAGLVRQQEEQVDQVAVQDWVQRSLPCEVGTCAYLVWRGWGTGRACQQGRLWGSTLRVPWPCSCFQGAGLSFWEGLRQLVWACLCTKMVAFSAPDPVRPPNKALGRAATLKHIPTMRGATNAHRCVLKEPAGHKNSICRICAASQYNAAHDI